MNKIFPDVCLMTEEGVSCPVVGIMAKRQARVQVYIHKVSLTYSVNDTSYAIYS